MRDPKHDNINVKYLINKYCAKKCILHNWDSTDAQVNKKEIFVFQSKNFLY